MSIFEGIPGKKIMDFGVLFFLAEKKLSFLRNPICSIRGFGVNKEQREGEKLETVCKRVVKSFLTVFNSFEK